MIGGGARSGVWNQIKADVLGVPYQQLGRSEFATWGAALIAGFGVGLFNDLAEAAQGTTMRQDQPVLPNSEHNTIYQTLAGQYIGWQNTLRDAFRSQASAY